MAALSMVLRTLLLLGPLVTFAGHLRTSDVVTTTAELNRCLTAARVALTKRGGAEPRVTVPSIAPTVLRPIPCNGTKSAA
jgi:hypothetical protein